MTNNNNYTSFNQNTPQLPLIPDPNRIPYSPSLPLENIPLVHNDSINPAPNDVENPLPSTLLVSVPVPSSSSSQITDNEPPAPTPPSELELYSPAWILSQYQSGAITLSYSGPNNIIWTTCPLCNESVSSGIADKGKQPEENDLYFLRPLAQHIGGSKCRKAFQRLSQSPVEPRSRSRSLTPASFPLRARSESLGRDMPLPGSPIMPFTPTLRSASLPRQSQLAPSSLLRAMTPSEPDVEMTMDNGGCTCPAHSVVWNVPNGSFNETFPWHRIGDGPSDLPFIIEIYGYPQAKVYARSKTCLHRSPDMLGIHPCAECSSLQSRIRELEQIASRPPSHTKNKLLNHVQLETRLKDTKSQLNDCKLKSLNAGRRLATAAKNLSEYKSFVMALADCNVPRLDALIGACLRAKVSVRVMSLKLGQAMEKLYSPKGFTSKDMDLSLVIMRMGGRSLLYTCHEVLNLPSVSTLFENMSFVKVMSSIGGIDWESICWNINEVLLKSRPPNAPRRGMSIVVDETALNEQAVYHRHSNSVGGLCWLHTTPDDLVLRNFGSAELLARKLQDGEVHFAKELTVAAVTMFGESRIFPILLAGTCKQETAEDVEKQMDTLIEAVVQLVEEKVGQLWSFATDGDPNRRPAGYNICMKVELSYDDPLYPLLSHLTGLNLQVGKYNITLDFDWKHILKRWSTNVRSPKGVILNNGRIIDRTVLERFMVWSGLDRVKARALLYPDDPQDVPRAIELLQAIIKLRDLRLEQIPPTELDGLNTVADLDAIRILSEVLEGIVRPFTDTSLDLQDQVRYLSKYAHLTFTMFRKYRTGFMSNQLYGDSQMMVKTAMFTIAKQQVLDPTAVVRLGDLGTDKMERNFGRLRMLGGHDSGMNERQATERQGQAQDLDCVYERHPEWEPSPRRLNLTRSESVDHLQYANWTGDLVAGHCNLELGWRDGRADAKAVLLTSQLSRADFDFLVLFNQDGVDMSRPHGGGKYPGVDKADITEDESREPGPTAAASSSSSLPIDSVDGENSQEALAFEEEQVEPENLQLPTQPGVVRDDFFMSRDGHPMHKATACRLIINKHYSQKSKNRQTRVYSNPRAQLLMNASPEESIADKFVVGNLFVTLFRTEKMVSLCVARSTTLKEGGVSCSAVACASLKNAKQDITISGEILMLQPALRIYLQSDSCEDDLPPNPEDDPSCSKWSWFWNGCYHAVDSAVRGVNGVSTEKPVVITVPSSLTLPVNPAIFDASNCPLLGLDDSTLRQLNSQHLSWAFQHDDLLVLMEDLWDTFSLTGKPVKTLPAIKSVPGFPYTFTDGSKPIMCQEGVMQLLQEPGASSADLVRQCHFCGDTIKGANLWRAHIGQHILQSLRGVIEPNLKVQIGPGMPCGFCGCSGRAECAVSLLVKAGVEKIESKCLYAVPISYKTARKGSATTRCRNVPILCALCPRPQNVKSCTAVWLYNMPRHLAESHPEYHRPGHDDPELTLLPLPLSFWKEIEVTAEEEAALGIPEEHRLPAFTHFMTEIQSVESANDSSNKKRKRSQPSGPPAASTSQDMLPPSLKRARNTWKP
ncbi:hypothetical protein VKT23_020133 [Stygiomarasmius scandens]|uniref:C2H2-type domain-containing protein n=1 Tax=Marasmiellus scandens TaxID=2682957 RepID=A0ABR1IMM8_9AGAR